MIYLNVYPFIYLFIFLSMFRSNYLSFNLSFYFFIYLSIFWSTCLSFDLPVYLFIYLSILSFYHIYFSIYLGAEWKKMRMLMSGVFTRDLDPSNYKTFYNIWQRNSVIRSVVDKYLTLLFQILLNIHMDPDLKEPDSPVKVIWRIRILY